MADCEKIMQLCEESLDRELTAEEQALLDRHLAECPACAAYLADLQFMREELSPERIKMPAGLHEKIMTGVMAEVHSTVVQPHVPNRRLPVFTMIAAAAACVALVLSGAVGDLMNNMSFSVTSSDSSASSSSASSTADMAADATASAVSYDSDAPRSGEASAEAAPAEENASRAADYTGKSAGSADAAEAGGYDTDDSGNGIAAQSAEDDPGVVGGAGGTVITFGEPKVGSTSTQPQAADFVSRVMGGEAFAFCYLAEYGGELPEFTGELAYKDDTLGFAYYVVNNNLSQLENLLDSLEKAGFSVSAYEETGLILDQSAESGILIVRL